MIRERRCVTQKKKRIGFKELSLQSSFEFRNYELTIILHELVVQALKLKA